MRYRTDWRPITVDGAGRVTDLGSPHRGWGWFGVWELDGRRVRQYGGRDALVAAGLTQIDCRKRPIYRVDEQWALLTPALPLIAFWLLVERFTSWANMIAARLAWRLGLVEPSEALTFSWRRDFSPRPWRGRRRMKPETPRSPEALP